jgi:NAD(P)-dependent dehydrogenase (short-subunit alcohol dehydrogenase family)
MRKQLEGKITLVTGASSGIGRATALVFAREGAKVIIADLDEKGGQETIARVKAVGSEAIFVKTDVSRAMDVEALVRKTLEAYGRLDCAVNNAGTANEWGLLHEASEETWDHVIHINLKGVWLCMKYEIPPMLKQGGGVIVNISSIMGLVGHIHKPIYAASKHGVIGLTKSAALQYAKFGIRVNAVCPGWIRTPITESRLNDPESRERMIATIPLGRVGSPEEVAEAVVWLCSEAASFVTGHTLLVDGGFMAQ